MNKKYERYINYIVNDLEIPYFKNMKEMYGLSPDEYELVLSKVYNQPVTIKDNMVYNQLGNVIYYETSYGHWQKKEYDDNGNLIYSKNSSGIWEKFEYDANGNEIYYERSNGHYVYDNRGDRIYIEDQNSFWEKREYDENGKQIYFENSDGEIVDNR